VFIDGRIAAGPRPVDIEKIVRDVYRAADYGGPWNPDPRKIRVTTELCQEVLSAEESDIRPFSDYQNGLRAPITPRLGGNCWALPRLAETEAKRRIINRP
jgi:hypothetical protein